MRSNRMIYFLLCLIHITMKGLALTPSFLFDAAKMLDKLQLHSPYLEDDTWRKARFFSCSCFCATIDYLVTPDGLAHEDPRGYRLGIEHRAYPVELSPRAFDHKKTFGNHANYLSIQDRIVSEFTSGIITSSGQDDTRDLNLSKFAYPLAESELQPKLFTSAVVHYKSIALKKDAWDKLCLQHCKKAVSSFLFQLTTRADSTSSVKEFGLYRSLPTRIGRMNLGRLDRIFENSPLLLLLRSWLTSSTLPSCATFMSSDDKKSWADVYSMYKIRRSDADFSEQHSLNIESSLITKVPSNRKMPIDAKRAISNYHAIRQGATTWIFNLPNIFTWELSPQYSTSATFVVDNGKLRLRRYYFGEIHSVDSEFYTFLGLKLHHSSQNTIRTSFEKIIANVWLNEVLSEMNPQIRPGPLKTESDELLLTIYYTLQVFAGCWTTVSNDVRQPGSSLFVLVKPNTAVAVLPSKSNIQISLQISESVAFHIGANALQSLRSGSRKHEILSNTLTGSEKKQQTFSKYMDVVQFTPQNFKIPESTLSFSPTKVSCKQAHQSFVSKKEQTTEKWTPMSDPIAARSSFTVQKLHSEHDFYDLFDVDPIALGANARNSPRKKGALKHTSAKRSCNRAQLYEGFDKRNSKKCMIKIINKTRLPASAGGERLWRKLCKKLLKITARHPGLMTISDVFETNDKFYIISEKMRGGELFDFLLGEKAVPEELCKYIIRQILQALDYLHSSYLVHRDIKPENVMFRRPRPTVIVNGSQNSSCGNILRDSKEKKRLLTSLECSQSMSIDDLSLTFELAMIDFDTCKMTDTEPAEYHDIYNGRRRLVGTYGYLAPEVLKGHEYTKISDLWSVGIILYILMTVGNNILKKIELFIKGAPPVPMEAMLNAQTSLEILEEIKNSGIDFQLAPFPEFPKAQDLCRSLLEFDPNNRIKSAKMALEHTWLTWTMSKVIPSPSLPVNQNEEWISTCSCEEESDSCQFAGNSALRLNIRMDNFASLGNADTPKLSTFWLNYDITKVPAR